MKQLNIGIVAHVDAGKTSLTERLLHTTGVIDHVGSVDDGSTQTDSLDLERRRGITIQSAVVSFHIGDLKVNLIDTPGHSDFIAEVARAMHVLDGAILVVSAVEGVQAQTRVLMRTLKRLGIPTIIFVNKIDRMGARYASLLADLRRKLSPAVVALSTVDGVGAREAVSRQRSFDDPDVYAELADALGDEAFLSAYLDGEAVPAKSRRNALARRARRGTVHPVYFGSAVTGAGLDALIAGIRRYLPYAQPKGETPRGSVFKIERGPSGEKIAYVRLREGTLRSPTRVRIHRADPDGRITAYDAKVTAVRVFTDGSATEVGELSAGGIAKVWGLRDALIGDAIGSTSQLPPKGLFVAPTLETAVKPVRPQDRMALWAALRDLAERDPFIDVRQVGEEATVSLYGEVQKEVIASMLAEQFGIAVAFEETRTVHIERIVRSAEALRDWGQTPYPICVGLRIDPGEPGSGVTYRIESQRGMLLHAFHTAVEETVYESLRDGRYGWRVIDCVVTLTKGGYGTGKTAGQFREIVPGIVRELLLKAGTKVYMPVHRFDLEVPAPAVPAVVMLLTEFGAILSAQEKHGENVNLTGTIDAGALHGFERRLPGITSGEAVFQSELDGHRPVHGQPPRRSGSSWTLFPHEGSCFTRTD